MKHFLILSAVFAFSLTAFSLNAQRKCGTMDILEQQLQENPRMQYDMERIEQFTQEYIRKSADEKNVTGT